MNIDKLRKSAATLNEKLKASGVGKNKAALDLIQAQIEFNNAALEAITGMQKQMEKLEAASRDQ